MPPPQRISEPFSVSLCRLSRECGGVVGGGSLYRRCGGGLLPLLFVFVSCVVPLSTPSSTQAEELLGSSSSSAAPNSTIVSSATPTLSDRVCPSALKLIRDNGSFCHTLRASTFIRNLTELAAREHRAIDMFCELDRILERLDCNIPYSVNVDRQQCWLCREAYRDWVCAMTSDTTDSGEMDCDRRVMPCPSCASICHQVMRLCPYLTPDRVQYDEEGDATSHVSQYGGHPAFYCPLENTHASDPAYTSECVNPFYTSDPDELHNLCAADARFRVPRSKVLGPPPAAPLHYSSCCWTYASSLVSESELLERSIRDHGTGYHENRVLLNCCDESKRCVTSDPERPAAGNISLSSISSTLLPPTPQATPGNSSLSVAASRTQRTANNQVLDSHGNFRELNNMDVGSSSEDDEDDYYYEYSSAFYPAAVDKSSLREREHLVGQSSSRDHVVLSQSSRDRDHVMESSSTRDGDDGDHVVLSGRDGSSLSSSSSSSDGRVVSLSEGVLVEGSVISNSRDNKYVRGRRSVQDLYFDEASAGVSVSCSYLCVVLLACCAVLAAATTTTTTVCDRSTTTKTTTHHHPPTLIIASC